MRINKIRIRNFRSIQSLDVDCDETTVFIGANNAGKSAIVDAVRIALTRRWGQRGSGFTEHDIYKPTPDADPRELPPVTIEIVMEEPEPDAWATDLIQALDDIMAVNADGRNVITLRITCGWNTELEAFEPTWDFLDIEGVALTGKAKRATNLSGFFGYIPLFWLGALRNADDEFTARSQYWGRLVRSVNIPKNVESEVQKTLDEVDARLLATVPKLDEIAEMIEQATTVAMGEGPGGTRLRMLPLNLWDLLSHASVVMRHEDMRPWLPLDHHGQGLQSLSVIFLFQAAVLEQLANTDREGVSPVFAVEEPEAHLHPQAARTLWEKISALPGQKLVTTHSPYFVQHVPLRDLRIARLSGGRTELARMPRRIVSDLPWNERVEKLAQHQATMLEPDPVTGKVAARTWFDEKVADCLANCWRGETNEEECCELVRQFRIACRVLVSPEEEIELSFAGRRVRGEIFFARRWVLVEGASEYLLLHALGKAFDWPLDTHGVAVIDFQNNGNASIYPALADAFGIPWRMVTDGDAESEKFRLQLQKRGFLDTDLNIRFSTLTPPHNLEDQLLADGHEQHFRNILVEIGQRGAASCSLDELRKRLSNEKTGYMAALSRDVATDKPLAEQMPKPFLDLLEWLRSNAV